MSGKKGQNTNTLGCFASRDGAVLVDVLGILDFVSFLQRAEKETVRPNFRCHLNIEVLSVPYDARYDAFRDVLALFSHKKSLSDDHGKHHISRCA
jgi:hypothetical protein